MFFFRSAPWFIGHNNTVNNCTAEFMKNTWFQSMFLTNMFCIIAIGKSQGAETSCVCVCTYRVCVRLLYQRCVL